MQKALVYGIYKPKHLPVVTQNAVVPEGFYSIVCEL